MILPSLIAGLTLLLALALPCVLALRADPARLRDRHAPALALHRTRLAAIDRDRDTGLIAEGEHAAARLEIQRRLLAEADRGTPPPSPAIHTGRGWLVGGAVLIPLATLALYLSVGHPSLPSAPMALRLQAQHDDPQARRDAQLIATLRARIAALDPASQPAIAGNTLLGRIEATQGHWAEAAAAWRTALAGPFDPDLAVSAAEAQVRADGRVSPASADLYRRALTAAPADAPWRALAQQRLVESEAPPR